MSWTQTPADEPVHDVLAAEAFAMPAPDPALRHGPVMLPDDPTGIEEPHDILAAEEFAMPAAPLRAAAAVTRPARDSRQLAAFLCGALLAVVVLRLLRRR